jgi:hypothetical protein
MVPKIRYLSAPLPLFVRGLLRVIVPAAMLAALAVTGTAQAESPIILPIHGSMKRLVSVEVVPPSGARSGVVQP